mgnify:CR=1 FL=1
MCMCAPVISLDFQPHKHKQTLNFDTGKIKRIIKNGKIHSRIINKIEIVGGFIGVLLSS